MRLVRVLFAGHLAALLFGLTGLALVLPHAGWFDPSLLRAIPYGMRYTGSLHILFGAATMLAFGAVALGWRRTLTFFAAATLLPLGAELLGTATGFPFGGYAYTSGLGFKIAGRVPFAIPLSWFYMGFASFLLATLLLRPLRARFREPLAVLLGAWLLTAWDLALDPAMASARLPVKFWVWHETGPYFGMPLRNFVGWCVVGLIFMGVSRLLWRGGLEGVRIPAWLPFGVYLANMTFAAVLSVSVGLWEPLVFAGLLGLVPATLVWRTRGSRHAGERAAASGVPRLAVPHESA